MMRARFAHQRQRLEGLARVLDGLSYRSVLERGFALVKGEDGKVRRRAGEVKAGEGLTLTFADGEAQATAGGTPPKAKARKSPTDQGNLF
jgi:exodeoxyribonuclease VII large subunit